MSIAPLLLAFLSVAGAPASDSSSGAVLLNFHAEWCGPCHKARPAVEQLIRDGYPIKTDRYRRGTRAPAALPRRRRARPSSWSIAQGASSTASPGLDPPASWRGSTRLPRPRHDRRELERPRRLSTAIAAGEEDDDEPPADDGRKEPPDAGTARREDEPSAPAGLRQSQAVGNGRPHPGDRQPLRPASAPARSSTARPRSR